MRLPNCAHAEVAPEKVRHYLLSSQHRFGRFKARFFRALGYDADNWTRLVADLRAIARWGDSQPIESPFGKKFSIVSLIVSPNGRSTMIVSIWIIDAKSSIPRFVTGYPAEGR